MRASLQLPPALCLLFFCVTVTASEAAAQNGPLALGGVEVTPDGASEPARQSNTSGYIAYFVVKNTYTQTVTYQLTCFGRNSVTCTGAQPSQVTLGPGAATEPGDVYATYSVGAPNGHGRIVLDASGAAQDTGYYNVVIADATPPVVTLRNHNGDNRDRSL